MFFTIMAEGLTILNEYCQTFLDQQACVKHDQTETQRQNIVARPDFQELSYLVLLRYEEGLSARLCHTLISQIGLSRFMKDARR